MIFFVRYMRLFLCSCFCETLKLYSLCPLFVDRWLRLSSVLYDCDCDVRWAGGPGCTLSVVCL